MMGISRNEKRSCGCVVRHERVFVCEMHAELPVEIRDKVSELVSKGMDDEVRAQVKDETKRLVALVRKVAQFSRWVIVTRGCECEDPNHRCSMEEMGKSLVKLEEEIP